MMKFHIGAEGNRPLQEAADQMSTYPNDAQNRLIVSAAAFKTNKTSLSSNVNRKLNDGADNRCCRRMISAIKMSWERQRRRAAYGRRRLRCWLDDTAYAKQV